MSRNVFEQLSQVLQNDVRQFPTFARQALEIEGMTVLADAKRLSRVNTGYYRASWQAGPVKRSGNTWTKRVWNNADYAYYLEYGFRSHFVPGEWVGNVFRYDPSASGGMYVGPKGGYVRGDFTLKRSTRGSAVRLARYMSQRMGVR